MGDELHESDFLLKLLVEGHGFSARGVIKLDYNWKTWVCLTATPIIPYGRERTGEFRVYDRGREWDSWRQCRQYIPCYVRAMNDKRVGLRGSSIVDVL